MNGAEVMCLGELMLDMVAREAENGEVGGFDMRAGGAAGNVAVATVRLGGSAGMIAKVSDDFFGRYMKRIMAENRVDVSGVVMDAQRKIAMAFVTFDAEKKPSYLFYRENSASASFAKDELLPHLFDGAKALYFSSMGLVRDPMRSTHYEAVRLAEQCGTRIAFDPNIRFGVWPSRDAVRDEVRRMMPHVNICKMNDEELAFLYGEGDVELKCREMMRMYPKLELAAITLGADGALLMNQNGVCARVPALDNDVIDTVGAGDSFFATLIRRAILKNFDLKTAEDLQNALEYANAAALITAKRPGAIPAMPFLAEVEEMRAGYEK